MHFPDLELLRNGRASLENENSSLALNKIYFQETSVTKEISDEFHDLVPEEQIASQPSSSHIQVSIL